MNTHPLQLLNPADRTLLSQAILDGFSLPALLSRAPDAHPAQKCILSLLEWFELPHIKSAADRAIQTIEFVDEYSAKAARRPIREKLSRLFSLAYDNAADSQSAIRPENSVSAEKHKNSACREARLVMHQLVRMTISTSPRKRKSNRAPNPSPNPSPNLTADSATNPNSSPIYVTDLKSQFDSLLQSAGDLHHASPSTRITPTPRSPTTSAASLLYSAGTPRNKSSSTQRPTPPLPLHINLPSAPNAALIPPHAHLLNPSIS